MNTSFISIFHLSTPSHYPSPPKMSAFTPPSPLTTYTPKTKLLQQIKARGCLSPSVKSLARPYHSAWKQGTLPTVDTFVLSPSPSSSPKKPTTPKISQQQQPQQQDENNHSTIHDDLDHLCRRLDGVLDLSDTEQTLNLHHTPLVFPTLKAAEKWLGSHDVAFEKKRNLAATRLLKLFDDHVLDGNLLSKGTQLVSLSWSARLTKTAGVTRMKRLSCGGRRALIELSNKVVDEPIRLYFTLAHELCHAAAWILDDVARPPHGQIFWNWAAKFRKWDPTLVITTCHEYEIRYRFNYICTGCAHVYGRHSRSINVAKKVCGICRAKLQLQAA